MKVGHSLRQKKTRPEPHSSSRSSGQVGHSLRKKKTWPEPHSDADDPTPMSPMTTLPATPPPDVSPAETVDEIVRVSKRKTHFPIRTTFVQQTDGGEVAPGPLNELVTAGDRRGLVLFLLLATKASSAPWNSALPAAVWARALGIPLPETKGARSTVSKTWLRLEKRGLVSRSRFERLADVTLLKEDGSGDAYESPGEAGDRYFRVPLALWTAGPDEAHRWYEILSLPELAVLLISRSLYDGFRLPFEKAPDWYGISADTVSRGVHDLEDRGVLQVDRLWKKAPLSVIGHKPDYHYTLREPFGPLGPRTQTSAKRAKASAPVKTATKKAPARKQPIRKATAQGFPVNKGTTRKTTRRGS